MRWLEELGEPVEQQEQPGPSTQGTKHWSNFWETLKNGLGKGHSLGSCVFSLWKPGD